MGFRDFEEGDVIISMSADGHQASHSALWAGGASPIVHSQESKALYGVVLASTAWLDGSAKRPFLVFRQPDKALAHKAAHFAGAWASKAPAEGDAGQWPARGDGKTVVARTPFSPKRKTNASHAAWSVDSVMRVVKALCRYQDNTGLSPNNGVSCSQFVTYCYQAAALHEQLGPVLDLREQFESEGLKPRNEIGWESKHARETGLAFWRDKQWFAQRKVFSGLTKNGGLLEEALGQGAVERLKGRLPSGVSVDAKTQSVSQLYEHLAAGESAFKRLGTVAKDGNAYRINEGA